MFDISDEVLRKMMTEDWNPEWRGTCDLCGYGKLDLQHHAGCLLCRQCVATIVRKLKEANHPFVSVRVTMDPKLHGDGTPGDVLPLPAFKKYVKEKLGNGR